MGLELVDSNENQLNMKVRKINKLVQDPFSTWYPLVNSHRLIIENQKTVNISTFLSSLGSGGQGGGVQQSFLTGRPAVINSFYTLCDRESNLLHQVF